jgi:hypothetical protein
MRGAMIGRQNSNECALRRQSRRRQHRVQRRIGPGLYIGVLLRKGRRLENGYVEAFNGKLRDALLAQETFSPRTSRGVSVSA